MGERSAISWTDASFNGWIGCTEVGPGCVPCYARELDRKYQWGLKPPERVKGTAITAPHWGDDRPRHRTAPGYWRQPLRWNEVAEARGTPMKVFAHSLSDVFDNEVPQAWREDEYELWRTTPWLRWIVLTKRVPNVKRMLPRDWGSGYPNVGLVATTVNQEEFDRDWGRLLSVPAAWHGFSLEPQLGPIVLPAEIRGAGSVWLITGGESRQGTAKRPLIDKDTGAPRVPVAWDPAWARGLIEAERFARNVSVFVKQLGCRPVGLPAPTDGAGADPEGWPDDLRVQHFPPELLS